MAVDVQNPLLGPNGCTRVYGPQKGLRPDDFEFAERSLEQLATIISKELHLDYANEPGAGAAGGLGYGLRCFAGARLQRGFAMFSDYAKLAERLKTAQLVITGEGAIDDSTLMGKGVGEIAQLCRKQKVPCIALAGVISERARTNSPFTAAHALTPDVTTPEGARSEAALSLERLAKKAAAQL